MKVDFGFLFGQWREQNELSEEYIMRYRKLLGIHNNRKVLYKQFVNAYLILLFILPK